MLRTGPRFRRRVGFRGTFTPRSTFQEVVVEVAHPRTELAVFRPQKPTSKHVRSEGVLLPIIFPVPKPMPVVVRRGRPLASPRPAFLTGQHIADLGIDLSALDFGGRRPRRGHNVPGHHPTLANHVYTHEGNVCPKAAVADEAPLVPHDPVFPEGRVQEPVLVAVVDALTVLAVRHQHGVPTSAHAVLADVVELHAP